jgi:serine/threonine protein kinase
VCVPPAHVWLQHKNIVQFIGICDSPPCILSEYCTHGSLSDVLRKARRGCPETVSQLSWILRLSLVHDAALGMLYLHSQTPAIIHRDFKVDTDCLGHKASMQGARISPVSVFQR